MCPTKFEKDDHLYQRKDNRNPFLLLFIIILLLTFQKQ